MHVLGQVFAKCDPEWRKWAAPVPLDRDAFRKRLAPMGYASDAHIVAIGSLKRRDDRHTLPGLGQRQ